MWIWRRIEKISWVDKVSNAEVLQRVNEGRSILDAIWQRKQRWLGHVLRHDCLLRDIREGRMMGKVTRGRKRLQLMSDMYKNKSYVELKREAQDRTGWKTKIIS